MFKRVYIYTYIKEKIHAITTFISTIILWLMLNMFINKMSLLKGKYDNKCCVLKVISLSQNTATTIAKKNLNNIISNYLHKQAFISKESKKYQLIFRIYFFSYNFCAYFYF